MKEWYQITQRKFLAHSEVMMKHQRILQLILVITGLATLVLAGCISESVAELTSKQVAQKGYLMPVPDPGSFYSNLEPRWFEKGDTGCRWLATFFLDNGGRRVAMMGEVPVCGLLPKNADLARSVSIGWASDENAYFCEIDLSEIPLDNFEGDSYETCLAWMKDTIFFMVYTTLPEDETLNLVNSLVLKR